MTENPDPLAQALDQPQAKASKKKRDRDPLRWARLRNQALILETNGNVEVHAVKHPHIHTASGAYTPQSSKRFYLHECIGPGWVTIFTSGNPEPITTVAPAGFGAALWSQLVGGKLVQLAFGAFDAPDKPFEVKPWMRWALLGVAGLVLVGVFVWQFTHTGKGA